MEKMINEYLDKIIQARQDITISDAFRSYLIEFRIKPSKSSKAVCCPIRE